MEDTKREARKREDIVLELELGILLFISYLVVAFFESDRGQALSFAPSYAVLDPLFILLAMIILILSCKIMYDCNDLRGKERI